MATKKLAYTLTKSGSKVCTVNKTTGKTIQCYKDRAGALRGLKALYASSGDPVGKDAKASLEDSVVFDEAMECVEGDCERTFLSLDALAVHIETVHPDDETAESARFFSAKERKKHAASGAAMKDGSFPIKNATDLKNAIRLAGNAKNPAAAKAHIIKRAKALGLTKSLPADWASGETSWLSCPECTRHFRDESALADHAESVHTFSDIQRLVNDTVREAYGSADEKTWVYVEEMATDWVVFCISGPNESDLYKAPYVISAQNAVTLGEPVEVVRRTIYEVVEDADPLPTRNSGT